MNHNEHGNYGKNGNHGSNGKPPSPGDPPFHSSHDSHSSHSSRRIIPPRGDYHTLLSYQKASVIYQITYRFCQRFLAKDRRVTEQMVPAARSGKQNIIEGSKAATTSKETEIRLTNAARASLEELLEDYLDFLTTRDLRTWEKDSREARHVRKLATKKPLEFEAFREFTEIRPAEVVANIAVCLIHQANYLLDRQLKSLEEAFLNDGGLRERMSRERRRKRDQQQEDG